MIFIVLINLVRVVSLSEPTNGLNHTLYVGNGCSDILSGGLHTEAVLITSTGSPGLQHRRPDKNVWSHGQPLNSLWLFHENSWEVAHERVGITPMQIAQIGFVSCATDVFAAEPWLWSVQAKGGALDQFYAYAGDMEPCDQPLRVKSGKLLVRKLAAMRHAVSAVQPATVVIWIDTDVVPMRKPDAAFLSFVRQHDISLTPFTTNMQWGVRPRVDFETLDSPLWRIESGVVALVNGAGARRILDETTDMYRGALLQLVQSCVESCGVSHPICTEPWFQRNAYLDDICQFTSSDEPPGPPSVTMFLRIPLC
jgi:hypothetical protein